MTRTYEMKQRSERQNETRQKIVEATIHLHQTKGIVATTINDIADLAGVGRVTVYRHFPDELSLVGACSGQYFERHPFPDPESWVALSDPLARLECGLSQTYNFFAETDAMLSKVYAEAREHPVMAPYHAHWAVMAEMLAKAWPDEQQGLLRPAIALALDYDTWRTLTKEQGLDQARAVNLMTRLTCDCGGS